MAEGLGLRWSIIGPFETTDRKVLRGIMEHAKPEAAAYAGMGAERGQHDPWTEELAAEVCAGAARGAACRKMGGARRLHESYQRPRWLTHGGLNEAAVAAGLGAAGWCEVPPA
jgi:hypothetical protein